MYKHFADQMIRRCVPEEEIESILAHCHGLACGGHFGGNRTAAKVLQLGFYWPALFKDAHRFVSTCDKFQRMGSISKWDKPPLQPILEVELFDIWGMYFIGLFPSSFSNLYILLAVDYVSKWVEAIPIGESKTHSLLIHFFDLFLLYNCLFLFGNTKNLPNLYFSDFYRRNGSSSKYTEAISDQVAWSR